MMAVVRATRRRGCCGPAPSACPPCQGLLLRCPMPRFAVILPAAGKSSRFRDREKKPFANLDGRAVWLRVAELFASRQDVCRCVVVIAPEDDETFRRRYGAHLALLDVRIVHGGAERFES